MAATLYDKQAKQYRNIRPSYPPELFQFIASKTPIHDLAWDAGAGNGQATLSLAGIYKNVVATDTSQNQLQLAPDLPNVRYQQTTPLMTEVDLHHNVAAQSSVDVVTVAQALHWFDISAFFQQAKWVLKKPQGVIAAWCYTAPEVNESVDSVFNRYYLESKPYWDPARNILDDKYRSIDFPFMPVDGEVHTGPFKFKTEKLLDLDGYFAYLKSSSGYQMPRKKGVELLRGDVVEDFERAWHEDGNAQKIATFPIYLRIGKVATQIKKRNVRGEFHLLLVRQNKMNSSFMESFHHRL